MISWGTFIGALTGVVIGLSIMDRREVVNQTRYSVACQGKSDSARAFFEGLTQGSK